ncbi:hypothetical protein A3H65_01725 [Candidatus Giovannonibacteria bacterium RIFCSPLOWO2_02_FULL_45_14]|uniref:histidine kinase n=1 Tax=Candidatus Giovannonibacteria bacterium RIFCSPLOWO2_12_FULL_44_15 TaxID=1798364 RepID=A0A1F5XZH0_9BACT|nr:MAG: hypothetical protein A3C75_01935 [Candidatus Giovannonibacteria bacterium RIFCSPHIGHO2_02_FULL_44_31]OGF75950.1 MAG: hypothetical protein A3E62_03280 [Candidatus Giovannonibacteria bacterium RIFCSPHIGHO2_12_FULL_44_29]OGF91010.1 MAG: hypothetical protein A3H65_01725 [Candidatus Giovannonibacteria bacterium RIFCSPLOWO2_02_FULL_45_14]OGF93286.1 MAG: hypothetical protein A3G54_02200 [Candidatus Giovannonibacteria bacterium RIFCSPLOWO2_12_FULL_44_15]
MILGIILPTVVFLNLLLGFLIIIKNPRAANNRFFALLSFTAALWTFANYMTGIQASYFWLESTYALGALMIATSFIWASIIVDRKLGKFKTFFIILLAAVFFAASYWPGFIAASYDHIYLGGIFTGKPGFGLILYTIFYLLSTFFILKKLYIARDKTDKPEEKTQFRFIFYGALIAISISAMTSFILPVFSVFSFGGLDSIGFLIFLAFIAYSITRQNLFNIKLIATELLVFSLWIFLLVRIFLSDVLRDQLIDGSLLALVIFFGILLIRSVLHEVRQREEISKLAEDLRKANSELKRLDQLKSDFVSLASHQLRTPLTVIKGYISLIQEGTFGQIQDKLADALRKIYISNETLINLVGDFLNLSRIESGKMKYMFEPIAAEEMIQSVFEEFKEVVKDKKLELRYEKPTVPLARAMLDRDKFRQVIMNLVDNAIKYTPSGFVTLKLEEEKTSGGAKNILFSVSDSGVGMSKEDLDGIFKRFARGEGGSKVNTSGLGLGLYLAKRIVTDHGGEIWATSDGPGKGSTFWVRLPARAAEIEKEKQFKEFVEKI